MLRVIIQNKNLMETLFPIFDNNGLSFNQKRSYSTSYKVTQELTSLSPNWITGFSDGDSSFSIAISKNKAYKTGWTIVPSYAIQLCERDLPLLERVQTFFNVGRINRVRSKNHFIYVVNSVKDLHEVIIPHFDKYPLLTIKGVTFVLFKEIVRMLYYKEHLSEQGLLKIMSIKAIMNKRNTKIFKDVELLPIEMPVLASAKVSDITPEWITGFTDAEGCFLLHVRFIPSRNRWQASARFSLVQHSRDVELFKTIIAYLDCGVFFQSQSLDVVRILLEKFEDIDNKIIPHFEKYPLQSSKYLNYLDFKKGCDMIRNKEHLTEEGLEQLKILKAGMNFGRNYDI